MNESLDITENKLVKEFLSEKKPIKLNEISNNLILVNNNQNISSRSNLDICSSEFEDKSLDLD
ncbi:12079_t:CDS:2 [Dentiscutata erythropus]|uniref:12079_t:CDS:1 n=1 Tax=Dentiscutata erythropus TaxID=1348616 RepID=A0A9N9JV78_9GLOM|nr:12079_t:CDS:2 [Dentiscutata erythropus]